MSILRCTHCGEESLEPGFIMDSGQSSQGYVRWVEGPLERGLFGGAKLFGRPKWQVEAYRCRTCHHLELFARNPS
ncbi:PF20097 family protein [Nonomuraea sp. B10E15]|uniref:PF20097 family protein n=1 Tax=Nonomuraea sp. B10E15 TaxID=3153560 RepID=UPI00325E8D35